MTINSLDPSQKNTLHAILDAKEEDDIFLVYGPPGTGKSELVVSLLFELAIREKKVLFVSQNTEALQVIDRMITRIEKDIEYPRTNHLSLKDFCLNLYLGEHRYLKYIRGQYSRLIERSLPTLHSEKKDELNNSSLYPLSYTHLDHIENFNSNNDQIGIDEMLKYYMQYVPEELMIEPLKDFSKINVRMVLKFIDNYKFKEKFHSYVAPQNELRYISSTNFEIKFDQIQAGFLGIKGLIDETDTKIKVKKDISILDYLVFLENYYKVSKYLNIYKITSKKVSFIEMYEKLQKVVHLSKKLIDREELMEGLIEVTNTISTDKDYIHQLDKDINQYDRDIVHIQELITKISKHIQKAELFSFHDFIILSSKSCATDIDKVVELFPKLVEFNSSEINQLISESEEFENRSKFIKPFSSLPSIFKDKLNISDKSAPRNVIKNKTVLLKLSKILTNTNFTVDTILKWQKETFKTNIKALNPLHNISEEVLEDILADSFTLLALLSSYKIDNKQTIGGIKKVSSRIHRDNNIYQTAKAANTTKVMQFSTHEFMHNINKNIEHQYASKEIDVTFQKYKENIVEAENLDSFIKVVKEFLVTCKDTNHTLSEIKEYLDIPSEYAEIQNLSALSIIQKQLKEIENMNIYSSAFFTLNTGQNIPSWFTSVSHLNYFNNINEFDNYVAHNKFMYDLKIELGVNKIWIDTLLNNPTLTYEYFAARVINTLVRSSFQHLAPTERPSIGTKFFTQYHSQLLTEKYDYYIKGLTTIRSKTSSHAQFLANPNNWDVGNTTMEKIRNNTLSIAHAYPIIAATPKDVAKFLKGDKEIFDYVIFDEASQLLPGQAIPSLFRAKHAVIIGDPHQMPPILTANIAGTSYEDDDDDLETDESILDLVRKQPQHQYHLKVHYRSESNMLFEPSRTTVYNKDGIEPIYESRFSSEAPIAIEDNLGYDVTQKQKYDQNFSKICECVQDYLKQDNDATFCILFTRADDLYSFKDFLAENEDKYEEIYGMSVESKILLSTVSNCQGIEGTYSILYLRHYDTPGGMWFFKETAGAYKRLNVSITRQRKALTLLMADSKTKWLQVCESKLGNVNTGPNARKSAELLQALLRTAGEIMDVSYLDKTLSNNVLHFDSPLTEQLYTKLNEHYSSKLGKELKIYCEVGWHIRIPNAENIAQDEKNIGFRIDIGIYSIKKKEFVLGIEMDGAAYHKGYDREHSDYNRQQVLATKGWDLYRIWSTNWLHNQKTEFEKLTTEIDSRLQSSKD